MGALQLKQFIDSLPKVVRGRVTGLRGEYVDFQPTTDAFLECSLRKDDFAEPPKIGYLIEVDWGGDDLSVRIIRTIQIKLRRSEKPTGGDRSAS
jgi:hypothetical protein